MSGLSDTISPETVSSTILIALANARKLGDPWKAMADEYLGPTEALLKRINALSMTTLRQLAEVGMKVDNMDKKVQLLFETLADALWELRGRAAQDPLMSILSAGTPSYFFEWSMGQSSDRVEAVLEFLAVYIPTNGAASDTCAQIRAMLPEYRICGETVRTLRAKMSIYEKMFENFTRNGHVQYSRLRRRLRADGFDAFEIRRVFPDIAGHSVTGTLG